MADIKRYLQWIGSCQIDNRIYFMDMTFNGMFYLDILDWSVHFVHRFSGVETNRSELSYVSIFRDDSIYFFPNNAKIVMKYNIVTQEEQIISIENCDCEFFVTVAAVRNRQFIYLFPFDLTLGVYVLNLQDQSVTRDTALCKLFGNRTYCGNVVPLDNGNLLIGLYGNNQLMEIDITEKKIISCKNLEGDIKIYSICSDGNNCWILTTNSTDIYEWSPENDTTQIYVNENPVWETQTKGMPYSNLIFLENEILVLNATLKYIYRIDKNKKIIASPIRLPEEFHRMNYGNGFSAICYDYKILEDKVLIYPCWGNMLLVYDKATKQIEGKKTAIWGREIPYSSEIFMKHYRGKDRYMEDRDITTLEGFMVMLGYEAGENRSEKNTGIGWEIHYSVLK